MDKVIAFFKDRENQKHYFKWLVNITRPYKRQLLGLLLLNALIAASSVFTAYINKNIVDYANDKAVFHIFLIILIVVQVFCLVGNMVVTLIQTMMTEKYAFYVRRSLFRHVMDVLWIKREGYHSEEILSRITSDVDKITTGVSSFLISMGSLLVQLVLAFFLLLSYSPTLAWLALGIGPIAGLMGLIMGRKMSPIQQEYQQTEADYRVFMQEHITKMDLIRIFGQEENSISELEKIQERRIRLVALKNRWSVFGLGVISALFTGTYLVAFVFGALQVESGAITFGTMTAFLSLVGQIQGPIYGLANKLPQIVGILASAGRVMEITELEKEEKGEDCIEDENICSVGIRAESISLSYDEEDVVSDLSFEVKPGQMVMVEGPSGKGKTTLLRAIMGFLPCKKGILYFYDSSGEKVMCGPNTRSMISYVPQGNTLFYGTIAENLRMADPLATDEELIEALKKACAWDFVKELPKGINTELGEKATGISEGQAQRISIARALLKKCSLLILDEATSALDEDTEYRILNSIFEGEHPTCIFVSHRKYLAKFAEDKIII